MNKNLLRRIVLALPAILLELAWIFLLFSILKNFALPIRICTSILSLLIVLREINKQGVSVYKYLWILLVLLFPLAGTVLYLVLGEHNMGRPLLKKIEKNKDGLPSLPKGPNCLYQEMEQADPRMAQIVAQLERESAFPLRRNPGTEYFPLGDRMLPRMLEDLETARDYIYMEYFIVQNGVMWDSIVEVLTRKVAEGVDVRFIYDDIGSIATYSHKNRFDLEERGIHCLAFNPVKFVGGTLNYRSHRKMTIIDGRIAYSGGVNLADEYINQKPVFGHWKDIGFRLTGPGVLNFTRMFLEFWNAFSAETITSLPSLDFEEKDIPADGMVLSFYDSPLVPVDINHSLYVDLLYQAKDYIWFYTPYLMLSEGMQDAFCAAASRGVDVRLILPGIPDKKMVYRLAHSYYPDLLRAGVRIFEYTPGFVHAKACLTDDKVCCIGTVNLDFRSLYLHFENNTMFYRASILKDLKADFLLTQEKCMEIFGYSRTFFQRLIDGILRVFAPLL